MMDTSVASRSRQDVTSAIFEDLPRVEVEQQFSDVRLLAANSGVKVYVARHPQSGRSLVLKCLQKEAFTREDFYREFHYQSFLSSHPNIVKCLEDVFETDTSYVFAEELASVGDLSKFVKTGGIGEVRTKRVAKQIAQALSFIHKKGLVHGDVCLENVFVLDRQLSLFKLGDFGNTQRTGDWVDKSSIQSAWAPPEVSLALHNEGYYVQSVQDAWQLGILIFVCLTGSYPWSAADITDRHYNSWLTWLKRKTTKTPPRFRGFTPRLLRLLRRLLEPRPELRRGVTEVNAYLSDSWLVQEKSFIRTAVRNDDSMGLLKSLRNFFIPREQKQLPLRHRSTDSPSQEQESQWSMPYECDKVLVNNL